MWDRWFTRTTCPSEGGPSYSGYSCSKTQCGTGGSREPPVPVKGVQDPSYLHMSFYSGYSCSKTQCGTGGPREPPVPVKVVPDPSYLHMTFVVEELTSTQNSWESIFLFFIRCPADWSSRSKTSTVARFADSSWLQLEVTVARFADSSFFLFSSAYGAHMRGAKLLEPFFCQTALSPSALLVGNPCHKTPTHKQSAGMLWSSALI